ncbi:MAG: leucyl aminopeptidase family protein [Rhodospirillaceae bacterium]|nr:leucyl aminopeptidase family protein [Rhodospirillaceae bacterium]
MRDIFQARATAATVPVLPIAETELKDWAAKQPARVRRWVESADFNAAPHRLCPIPDGEGGLDRVLLGVDPDDPIHRYSSLPEKLPPGRYRIEAKLTGKEATGAAIGFGLGAYRFTRYRADDRPLRKLVWPAGADRSQVLRVLEATFLVRDLINTPANDMGPAELAAAARKLARRHKAKCTVLIGDALLKKNYPTIHMVGRASDQAPRLVDMVWGKASDPKVTLVGKGVCFDTGGLDLKTAASMRLMKKDMGGAAQVLGLTHMIMDAKLPVRLRVLIPAVENSVSANAMRPSDIVRTRKGLTVEIGNTDAEGRLVLCDALTEADREKPGLIVDFATLTGAARVALGPDLPAMFTNDDRAAQELIRASFSEYDPLWWMPLWYPYERMLSSRTADLNNVSEGGQGGAITAALFLNRFVDSKTPWVHIDVMGWNAGSSPGRPAGGEAMGMRAVYRMIAEGFVNKPEAKGGARTGTWV